MQTLRSVILLSCLMGVVSTMINISLPQNSMKKQLLMIMGMITVLSVVTALTGEDMQLSLKEIDLTELPEISFEADNVMLLTAEEKYEEYFMEKLNKNGISTEAVYVSLAFNENEEIFAQSVRAVIKDIETAERAAELIKEDLPECAVFTEKADEV